MSVWRAVVCLSWRVLDLGLAALGRPGYLNVGHGAELGDDRSVAALRARTFEVLDFAYAQGIRDFDVARSYGRGEEFLGEWLRAHNPAGVTVTSKWGYVYTAGWEVAHDPPEVKHHDLATFRRQLAETRENLGEWLALYQIHSATPESGVLRNDEVLTALQETDLPLGVSVSGVSQAETIDLALTTGLFDAVQATWNLHERAAGEALARASAAGLKVMVKEALANGRLAAHDDVALAAALAQPWATVVLQRRRLGRRAALEPARPRSRAAGRAARVRRGQRGLLGAPLLAGLELASPQESRHGVAILRRAPNGRPGSARAARRRGRRRPRGRRAPRSARRRATAASSTSACFSSLSRAARRNSQQNRPMVTIEPSIIMIAPAALWSLAAVMPHSAWPAA